MLFRSHAYQQLQIISQDREKRLEYEAREKAIAIAKKFLLMGVSIDIIVSGTGLLKEEVGELQNKK